MLSSVDTALMGHLSAAHLGAVGIGSMIFNFIYWNFGFLRMGTTGMTAQAYGANDHVEVSGFLGKSIILSIVLAVVMILLAQPIINLSIYAMNVVPDQVEYVREYFLIRIWAAPATFLLYSLFGWYFGMQNALLPLVLTILINIANIIVSYYLVVYLDYGITGVALGTVAAQYIGLLGAAILLMIRYHDYLKMIRFKALLKLSEFVRFLDINKDLFLRTVCMTLVFGFVYSYSSSQGALSLAANVILLQMLNWMSYGIDGFAFASESMVGKYKGANDTPRIDESILLSFRWASVMAVLYALAYYVFGDAIIAIFSNDDSVIHYTSKLIFWMAILPLASFWCYIWDGIFIGLTASKAMRNSMFISMLLFFGTLFLLQKKIEPNHALWVSMIIFMVARGAILYLMYRKHGHHIA